MELTLDYARVLNGTEVRRTKHVGFESPRHSYSVNVTRDYDGIKCQFRFDPPAEGVSYQPKSRIPAATLTLPEQVWLALAEEIRKHCADKKGNPRQIEVQEHGRVVNNRWKPRFRRTVLRQR
jgi:hypothetical protein